MRRTQEEIAQEWEQIAQEVVEALKRDPDNPKALKKIETERKAVRSEVALRLCATKDERFLSLIFNILTEDGFGTEIFELWDSFSVAQLRPLVISEIDNLIKKDDGALLDWQQMASEVMRISRITNSSPSLWYSGVLLRVPSLQTQYQSLLGRFFQTPTEYKFTLEDIFCAKVLRLDNALNTLAKACPNLLNSSLQTERALGLCLWMCQPVGPTQDQLAELTQDRGAIVRDLAEEFINSVKDGRDIRDCWAEKVWDQFACYYEDGKRFAHPFPDHLREFVVVQDAPMIKVKTPITVKPVPQPTVIVSENDTEPVPHALIQSKLVSLGLKQGYEVVVARDNRSKRVGEADFAKITLPALPHLGGISEREATIIDYIDVLWLNHRHVVRALEIEYSTTIYSGLLRLSDLVIAIPNLRIAVSIVLPAERVPKLKREVARPTFNHLRATPVTYCTFEEIDQLYADYPPTFWAQPTKAEFLLPWKTFE